MWKYSKLKRAKRRQWLRNLEWKIQSAKSGTDVVNFIYKSLWNIPTYEKSHSAKQMACLFIEIKCFVYISFMGDCCCSPRPGLYHDYTVSYLGWTAVPQIICRICLMDTYVLQKIMLFAQGDRLAAR